MSTVERGAMHVVEATVAWTITREHRSHIRAVDILIENESQPWEPAFPREFVQSRVPFDILPLECH
jgi:hypothetical protein